MTSLLLDRLHHLADQHPDQPVFAPYPAGQAGPLLALVQRIAADLQRHEVSLLASQIDNGLAWIALDLACIAAGVCHCPIPPFFTPAQTEHALGDSGAELLVTLQPSDAGANDTEPRYDYRRLGQSSRIAPGIAKVTYTSGSTDHPKAVLLRQKTMETVAQALVNAVGLTPSDRHLVLMPLAVLLENIAGVYAPLLAGACILAPPLGETGLLGSSGVDGSAMLRALRDAEATTAISTPQTLAALTRALEAGHPSVPTLRFLAVGGAPVSQQALQQAESVGLPVFQGYGLSECASVVCLNRPGENRIGSVGRPLEQAQLRIAQDGEVLISGARFDGYLNQTHTAESDPWLGSGDLGHLDAEGYLWIQGRKKNAYATAFGRNVSPEWPERELRRHPIIRQAAVYGEAQPINIAVLDLVPDADLEANPGAIQTAIEQANAALPDYAQVGAWLPAREAFSVANGQLTGTGRPRREAIYAAYAPDIEQIFNASQDPSHDTL